jgi:AbrB family looped-hinge helix DNA binding protein
LRITSKGQVTIPADIREQAGLLPQTEVEFEFDGKAVRIVATKARKKDGRGARVVARLRGRGDVAMSTDAIMALTRDRWMTAVLVDSNVLLDLMTEDVHWLTWSAEAIEKAADKFRLVINPIVYAEVSIRFTRIEDLETVLPRDVFDREAIPYEAAFLAGKTFVAYRRRGGAKPSPLPDFFIGAHAAVAGYRLLTRDARRYRTYFPKVPLIAPDWYLVRDKTAPPRGW